MNVINTKKNLTKSQRRNERKRQAKLQRIEIRELRKRRNRRKRQKLKKNQNNPLMKISRHVRDKNRVYGEKSK